MILRRYHKYKKSPPSAIEFAAGAAFVCAYISAVMVNDLMRLRKYRTDCLDHFVYKAEKEESV